MIAICEPVCKIFSHEKFNSGFIHGLRLAYPQEKILFYADISHIDAIKRILERGNIVIGNIEYIPIKFHSEGSLWACIQYYFLFNKIFAEVLAAGSDKLFCLCFSPVILYIIKKLKQRQRFVNIKLTLVFHGEFEDIANNPGERLLLNPVSGLNKKRSFIEKIRQTAPADIPRKIIGIIERKVINVIKSRYVSTVACCRDIFKKRFPLKEILLWRRSGDLKYILLSPHIIANVEKYINVKDFNFYTVVLPTVFQAPAPCVRNEYVKFAIFGYGYSAMLQKVLSCLSLKRLNRPYEIRIIGMDNNGAAGFPNVTCPSPGRPLSREEMEKYISDIDMFLILYDKSLYRLSCSGSILEALSYMKPVLHFDNDCVNVFNKKECPIGMRCDSVDSMATAMEDIINNYFEYIPRLCEYRNNMLAFREHVAIGNNLRELRASFTW